MNPITPLGSGAGGPLPLEPTVFHLTNQAPKGLWERTWQKLLRDRVSLTCGIILLSIGIFCLLGPPVVHLGWGWTFDLQQVQLGASSPSLAHPFGTDILGRDLLVRCMHGGRVSLLLALLATVVSLGIGVTWGAVAGFTGGRLDAVLMRIVDLMLSMPYLLVVIVLMTIAPSGHVGLGPLDGRFLVMILALGLVGWLLLARIVRGQVISLREREYVLAARATGVHPVLILTRHILPNILGPVVVYTTFAVPGIMMAEAFLSFLGVGIREPFSSWGTLLRDGTNAMSVFPWLLVFPASLMTLTLFCMNLLGDGLRDALEPSARRNLLNWSPGRKA